MRVIPRCGALALPFLLTAGLLGNAHDASAQGQGRVAENTPIFLLPDASRQPLTMAQKGTVVEVLKSEGAWLNVTFDDPRYGRRTGYIQSKFVTRDAPAPRATAPTPEPQPATPQVAAPRASAAAPTAAATPALAAQSDAAITAPRSSVVGTPIALNAIRRIFIEKMENDLDSYIAAEITKELKGRLVVVLDKSTADAIMRGVSESKTGVGAAITGRYLGLHDNASGSITIVDRDETVVLWASEAGDRSLMWGVMARGGPRKVADRLVNNLKKELGK